MAADDFAAFQAEIAVLKSAEDDDDQVDADDEGDESFEDDDGTRYVWDPQVSKYMPEGEDVAAAPVAGGPPPP
eukprot:CAMPEP_0198689780 /NCGR_PEP_ID=MMETSP1468-20131203/151799_1 /TAXON_ID=1461545 /ORGANISM="Mantoniella sp, Strain CCMP1436" /LENGTH=72 /DNA_ID=CAMNT_0044441229 /DNA_START=74 /DNA_END=288 /DNA_ORIENTATION=+